MPRSQYTYDRSLLRDVAAVLGSVRHSTWNDSQRQTLDDVIYHLCDEFTQHDPTFSISDFCRRSGYQTHRLNMNALTPPKET